VSNVDLVPEALPRCIQSKADLDRGAASEVFEHYLEETASVDQIGFINVILDELTSNGVMDPKRLFESPFTDHARTGPDSVFPDADVDVIVAILHDIRHHAVPTEVA